MDRFLTETLEPKVKNLYRIIIDDPEEVARYVVKGVREVRDYRRATEDASSSELWHYVSESAVEGLSALQ